MATPKQFKRRGRLSLILGSILAVLALGAVVASGAELVTAEVDGTANDVTVTQGSSANFSIKVSATNKIDNAITAASPATAKVNTSYTLTGGVLSSSTPSSAMDFFAGSTGCSGAVCDVTWSGAPTPYSVPATISADAATPVGTYTITLSSTAGTTQETNPISSGNRLVDNTATNITVHVVAPVVTNSAPTVDANITGDSTASEGDSKAYSIGATDPDGDTLTYAWSITAGSSGASINGSSTGSSVNIDFTDGPTNPVTLQVLVDDGHGHQVTRTKNVNVSNVAPQVALTSAPASADEGQTKTYNYSVNDPGADTYSVDAGSPSCGTGGSLVAASDSISGSSGSQTGTFQCSFPDGPASPTVSISITDSDGATGSASQAVTVNNVAPIIGALSLTGNTGTACLSGNTVNLQFSFSDQAGSNDTYTGSINWGDSSSTTAFGSSFNVNESHSYAPGTYTIKVNVADEDGGVATEKQATVSRLYNMSAILPPINPDGSSIFKYGSTIPVKVRITDCLANPVSGLAPTVGTSLANSTTPPPPINEEVYSTSAADTGNVMRYDATAGQYIYNFNTKSNAITDQNATYWMTVRESHSSPGQVASQFGVKQK